jgi:hypothetical protein
MSTAREMALRASTRQQAEFKVRNAANEPSHTSFDDVMAALDRQHLGRIVANGGHVEQTCTPEEIDMAMHQRKLADPNREAEAFRTHVAEVNLRSLIGGT